MNIDNDSLCPHENGNGRPIAVLMSGGVDSSVAALLLKQAGWDVHGFIMRLPVEEAGGDARFSSETLAQRVCEALSMPLHFLDVRDAFSERVIEPFCQAYEAGRTPNPCVMCNPAMKFGCVWDAIRREHGIEDLATGHYARILWKHGQACLARAVDRTRDQAYFLYRLPRERLAQLHFPLGGLASKDETRALARTAKLPVAERDDSMEICFVPDDDYRAFLAARQRTGGEPGDFVDTEGRVLGRHTGIVNYTIGQRRGLGLGIHVRLYVIDIDPEANRITLGSRNEASSCLVRARDMNIHQPDALQDSIRCWGKARSPGKPRPCRVEQVSETTLDVVFDEPLFAPTPGQHLVLYDEDDCILGGGVIEPSSRE